MSDTVKYAGLALLLVWLLVIAIPKLLKTRRNRKEEETLYRLTTVVITKDYGPVMVYLNRYTKELIPADNNLQAAVNYPPVILPEDLINEEVQWATAVERLEFLLGLERK